MIVVERSADGPPADEVDFTELLFRNAAVSLAPSCAADAAEPHASPPPQIARQRGYSSVHAVLGLDGERGLGVGARVCAGPSWMRG